MRAIIPQDNLILWIQFKMQEAEKELFVMHFFEEFDLGTYCLSTRLISNR